MATKKSAPEAKKPVAAKKAAPATVKAEQKPATKAVAEKPTKKVPGSFMQNMTPSKELAAVVGNAPLPRTQVIKGLWDYIKKNNLQDPKNKRMINADAKLKAVFGKATVGMLELTGLANKHLTAAK